MPWTPPKRRLTEEGFRKFIGSRSWTYAKTMPQWPHEWARRSYDDSLKDQELFEAAVTFIRDHGTKRAFEDSGSKYVYYDCDGRQYWTMGAHLGATYIINRAWINWKQRLAAGEKPESVATKDPPDGVIPVRPPELEAGLETKRPARRARQPNTNTQHKSAEKRNQRRAYEELRAGIEKRGGTMIFEKKGHQGGAWIVTLGNKQEVFPSNGRGFPNLDRLYTPDPDLTHHSHWKHYVQPPIKGAIDKLVSKLK
jgi:hypothetical protein